MRPSIFNQFIYFLLASVKFRAFAGRWTGWLHRLKLDETHRKPPQPTSSFALLQKKEERLTGPCWVSCRVNRWVSSHPQTCGSPFLFYPDFRNTSSHRLDSHTCAVQKKWLFFFSVQCLVHGRSWTGFVFVTANTVQKHLCSSFLLLPI